MIMSSTWDILHLKQTSNQSLNIQTTDTLNCAAVLEHAHLCSCSCFSLWIFPFLQTQQHLLLTFDFTDHKPLDPIGPFRRFLRVPYMNAILFFLWCFLSVVALKSVVKPEFHQTSQTGHLGNTNDRRSVQGAYLDNQKEFVYEMFFLKKSNSSRSHWGLEFQ